VSTYFRTRQTKKSTGWDIEDTVEFWVRAEGWNLEKAEHYDKLIMRLWKRLYNTSFELANLNNIFKPDLKPTITQSSLSLKDSHFSSPLYA
jgi:hypothetical protein